MSKMRKYNNLLFDMDGTIADTSEGIYNALRYAIDQLRLRELTEPEMHEFLGPPLKDTFISAFGMNTEEASEATKMFRQYYSTKGVFECLPYQGICDAVRLLHQNGCNLFVATSKPTPFAEKIVKALGLDSFFKAVVGSNIDNTRNKKAEIIQYILEEYCDGDKASCLMIGDKHNDVEGAKACNIDSLGVTFGFGSRNELEDACATYIVSSPEEIASLIIGQE